jgi:hypothetical protein
MILSFLIGSLASASLFSVLISSDLAWRFSGVFDDSYNFLEFPELNTLTPSALPFSQHFFKIIIHRGINVYEPVASILKAAYIDIVTLDPKKLRIVSLSNHLLNSLLLFVWLKCLARSFNFQKISNELLIFVSIMFFIHPLNMEVTGWLSAFSYVPALTFSLLSSISLEKSLIGILSDEKHSFRLFLRFSSCLIFFFCASLVSEPVFSFLFLSFYHLLSFNSSLVQSPSDHDCMLSISSYYCFSLPPANAGANTKDPTEQSLVVADAFPFDCLFPGCLLPCHGFQ